MEKEKELLENLQKALKNDLEKLKSEIESGTIKSADFTQKMDAINAKFDSLKDSYVEKSVTEGFQTQLDELNKKLAEVKQTRKESMTFVEEVMTKAADVFKDYRTKGKGALDFEIKSGPLSLGVSTTTGAGVILEDREPGINYEPKRRPLMLSLIRSGVTTSDRVSWVEKLDENGKPAFRKEFETFPKKSWKTVLKESLVKKIAVLVEYSNEIEEDLDGFMAELRRDLVEAIELELDKNILRGEGGGASDADLKGILEYAQAWNNGTYTDPAGKANIYDVLAVAVNQIAEEHHNANVIVMSPGTAMEMKLTKDEEGRYLMPPFSAANGVNVDGVRVVTNTLFARNEVLVMDGTRAEFKWKRGWRLEMSDSHSENFDKDVMAVRLSGRGALKIKDTDAKAFVYIANVKTAIAALNQS
jgi:HK97 family phage major capsid protein